MEFENVAFCQTWSVKNYEYYGNVVGKYFK